MHSIWEIFVKHVILQMIKSVNNWKKYLLQIWINFVQGNCRQISVFQMEHKNWSTVISEKCPLKVRSDMRRLCSATFCVQCQGISGDKKCCRGRTHFGLLPGSIKMCANQISNKLAVAMRLIAEVATKCSLIWELTR